MQYKNTVQSKMMRFSETVEIVINQNTWDYHFYSIGYYIGLSFHSQDE